LVTYRSLEEGGGGQASEVRGLPPLSAGPSFNISIYASSCVALELWHRDGHRQLVTRFSI